MSDADNGYTADEHELIMESAADVLLAAVAADSSGPVAYFEEMTAAGTFLYEAQRRYGHNRLVAELYERNVESRVDEETGEVTQESLLARIERLDGVLRRDDEGLEFRRFLVELAEHVARASRSSWLGPRISEDEALFLSELKRRLGLQ